MTFHLTAGAPSQGCNTTNRGGMIDDSGKPHSIMGQRGGYLVHWRKADSNSKNANVKFIEMVLIPHSLNSLELYPEQIICVTY